MIIAIFDTETTGLPLHPSAPIEKQPHIIEFGVLLIDSERNGQEVGSMNILIKPPVPITAEITKITGITNADVADAQPFKAHLDDIRQTFFRADVVVAHNLPFDRSLLQFELQRLGLDMPAVSWPLKEVCTATLYAPEWGRQPKLIELYQSIIGKPLQQTHRATDDCRALAECFIKDEAWRFIDE